MKETTQFVAILLAGCTMLSLGVGFVDKKVKEANYRVCYNVAYNDYKNDWNLNCKDQHKKENCALNTYLAESLKQDFRTSTNACLSTLEVMKK